MAENPVAESQLRELFEQSSELDGWLRDWRERLASDPQAVAERIASMRAASPAFIPRNHRVQAALALEYMAQMAFRLDVIELGGAKQ